MKKLLSVNRILICLIFLVLLSNVVFAVSLSPARIRVDFEPNLQKTFMFRTDRAKIIRVEVNPSDLDQYVTLEDPAPETGSRTVFVHLNLPESLETPGNNYIYLQATELPTHTYGVGGVASIRVPIIVEVPYPGIYAEMSLAAPSVNVGELAKFTVNVRNYGTEDLSNVWANIDIYEDNVLVKSVSTDKATLLSQETKELPAYLPTTGMNAGVFTAKATLFYAGNTLTSEAILKIGTLYIDIVDYTKDFEAGKINKEDIVVESKRNSMVKNVYADININDQSFKTPNYDLHPWGSQVMTAYFDATDFAEGEYDADITVRYEKKKTEERGKISVGEGEAETEPVEEEEETPSPIGPMQLVIISEVIVAILVVVVVVLILWKKKSK